MFSCEYSEIFKNTYFEEHLPTAASALLIMKLVISIEHLFLIKKHNVGWFLLRRFVDLLRVYSLLIISRYHSNTFLFLDLQKIRSKKIAARVICSDNMILTGLDRLLPTILNCLF